MKTRIISGTVAALLVVALLWLNSLSSIVTVIAVALLAAVAVYEMLCSTGALKKGLAVYLAMFYVFALQFSYNGLFITPEILTLLYVFILIIIAVLNHQNFGVEALTMAISMPIIIGFAFACIEKIINPGDDKGLLYFILLFNFACVTDIGAYFVGCSIGKNKLAPEISPKKTVEGAIGGVVCSIIGTAIICIFFKFVLKIDVKILAFVLLTPLFSIIGMFGDLAASVIKRHFGIKDYGSIMPGHGGVLDRLDSILLIAPAFILLLSLVG